MFIINGSSEMDKYEHIRWIGCNSSYSWNHCSNKNVSERETIIFKFKNYSENNIGVPSNVVEKSDLLYCSFNNFLCCFNINRCSLVLKCAYK